MHRAAERGYSNIVRMFLTHFRSRVDFSIKDKSGRTALGVAMDYYYILKKEDGGRHTPFTSGYKPQFFIRTTDVTGEVILPEGREVVIPGDTATFSVKLIYPVALEEKQRFAFREGGKTIGAGVVTKIIK